jgi:hypothetical protein
MNIERIVRKLNKERTLGINNKQSNTLLGKSITFRLSAAPVMCKIEDNQVICYDGLRSIGVCGRNNYIAVK